MKETAYLRSNAIGNNDNTKSQKDNFLSKPLEGNQTNKMKEFLKETAEIRKNLISDIPNINKNETSSVKPLKSLPVNFTYNSNSKNSSWFNNNNNSNRNFVPNSNSNNSESRIKYLSDFEFKNPDYTDINNPNFKINDEIGKKCLELTNEFRKKNRLPALK